MERFVHHSLVNNRPLMGCTWTLSKNLRKNDDNNNTPPYSALLEGLGKIHSVSKGREDARMTW